MLVQHEKHSPHSVLCIHTDVTLPHPLRDQPEYKDSFCNYKFCNVPCAFKVTRFIHESMYAR